MERESALMLAAGLGVGLILGSYATQYALRPPPYDPNPDIDRAIDADVRCHERCVRAGWGSLNAFYSPRHARCMCQDINPHGTIYNDFEGYRILRPSDLPEPRSTP